MKHISKEFLTELNTYLTEKGCHHRADVVHINLRDKVYFEITWGDWKHDHLCVWWLVEEFCESKGLSVEREIVETETDGSDCYSAEHYYTIIKKETEDE